MKADFLQSVANTQGADLVAGVAKVVADAALGAGDHAAAAGSVAAVLVTTLSGVVAN